jgi:hypothetical protein
LRMSGSHLRLESLEERGSGGFTANRG